MQKHNTSSSSPTATIITLRSMKIESAIEILAELLGSREEVLATLSEMLVADCEFTENQRREIFEDIKRLQCCKDRN